jgi:DNA-binding beta-propeller fold protein YncE
VGLAPFVVDVPITSNDSMPQSWNATLSDSPGWLALDTPSGTTPSSLKLRFAPGSLAPGNYSTTLRITSNGVVFEIPVRLTVSPLSIRKFLPDPRRPVVYAVNQNGYDAGELLEISTISKTITRAVRVGKEPSDFDVSEDGSKIWVINSKDPSIMAVSTVTWQVIETIPLTGFSSRSRASTEPGAHIKCGKGSIIYYVDEQWGPRLRVFDTATRILLQTFSAESGITPDTSNN